MRITSIWADIMAYFINTMFVLAIMPSIIMFTTIYTNKVCISISFS